MTEDSNLSLDNCPRGKLLPGFLPFEDNCPLDDCLPENCPSDDCTKDNCP